MSYILQESVGCCLQDADRHIYKSKDVTERFKNLFINLLIGSEYLEEDIRCIKSEIKETGCYETDYCFYNVDEDEAWVDFKDVYGTRTYLRIVD